MESVSDSNRETYSAPTSGRNDDRKHPSPEQVQVVIDTLQRAVDRWPQGVLRMLEVTVKSDTHACGTSHCHAGWYTAECIAEERKLPEVESDIGYISYESGTQIMAADLGFSAPSKLMQWAHTHEDIWGNRYGFDLFTLGTSMHGPEGQPAGDLRDIIHHWKEVKKRLVELEEKES